MSAHSPGPWTVELPDNGVVIADASGYTIAQVFGLAGVANARLIAAAPELLEAVRRLAERDCDDCFAELCDTHKSVAAVLARIDGGGR